MNHHPIDMEYVEVDMQESTSLEGVASMTERDVSSRWRNDEQD